MSRINTNVTALISSRILNANNTSLKNSLERLSTGLRINRGSDDPAGLIASENLRADKAAISSAIANAERASSIVSTAEGALNEVSTKLIKLQELVAQAANTGGMSAEEIAANQTQVDGIIASINRIASETSFQGSRLLDGSKDFYSTITGGTTNINDLKINKAKLGSADMTLSVAVGTAATRAQLDGLSAATLADDTVLKITGSKGSATLVFAAGTAKATVASEINNVTEDTGVSAYASAANYGFRSQKYGADELVTVSILSGGSDFTAGTDSGSDAVVTVNGASAAVDGYDVSIRTDQYDLEFAMTDAFAGATGSETITLTADGGAKFQLSPNIGKAGQEVLGLPDISTTTLGSTALGHVSDIATGGTYALGTDAEGAQQIVAKAIKQVAALRGRLGSFINDTVQSTINSLNVQLENVTAAESAIRDTDFATETANLTRNQILVNAATSVLSIANSAPNAILGLLR